MKCVIYLSEAVVEFGRDELDGLAQSSAVRNKKFGITGCLSFNLGRFVQYMEGGADEIDCLMEIVRRDVRHQVLHEAELNNLQQRRFPDWPLRFVEAANPSGFSVEFFLENNLLNLKRGSVFQEMWRRQLWKNVEVLSRIRQWEQREKRIDTSAQDWEPTSDDS